MTDFEIEQLCRKIKAYMESIKDDPKEAKRFLINAGIIDENGELTENYK